MIAFFSIATLVAGTLFGWYGHKASIRIRAWGLNLDEMDRNFRTITGDPAQPPSGSTTPVVAPPDRATGTASNGLPFGIVSPKHS